MKHLFYILFIFVFSAALQAQEVTITQSGGGKGRVDSITVLQDTIIIYYNSEGAELGRDTIAGSGGTPANYIGFQSQGDSIFQFSRTIKTSRYNTLRNEFGGISYNPYTNRIVKVNRYGTGHAYNTDDQSISQYSDDMGVTWSDTTRISTGYYPNGAYRVTDPVITWDEITKKHLGKVTIRRAYTVENFDWKNVIISSSDGITWDSIGEIARPVSATCAMLMQEHPVRLADSSLVITGYTSEDGCDATTSTWSVFFFKSVDGGVTWDGGTRIDTGDIAGVTRLNESQTIVRKNGDIEVYVRGRYDPFIGNESVLKYVSTDGGVTWSNPAVEATPPSWSPTKPSRHIFGRNEDYTLQVYRSSQVGDGSTGLWSYSTTGLYNNWTTPRKLPQSSAPDGYFLYGEFQKINDFTALLHYCQADTSSLTLGTSDSYFNIVTFNPPIVPNATDARGVTGDGTVNYYPKFTGDSVIADSRMSETASLTTLAIPTSTASAGFQVTNADGGFIFSNGTGAASAFNPNFTMNAKGGRPNRITVTDNTSSASFGMFEINATVSGGSVTSTRNLVRIMNNSVNRFIINNAGEVGIRTVTTQPTAWLEVADTTGTKAHLRLSHRETSVWGANAKYVDLKTDSFGNLLVLPVTTGRMGLNTSSPAASALLDLTSTTRGFLQPRMTTAQRNAISTPATGLQVYNTSLNKLNYFDGSNWRAVLDSALADSRFALLGGNAGSVTLGSNDNSLILESNNTTRRTYDASGNATENLADFTGTYTDDFRLGVNDTILMNANNGVAILRTTNNILEIEDDSTMIDQEVYLRDYGTGSSITGTAVHDIQATADGKLVPVTITDTVFITIAPLALTDSLKTVANLANDSWTVPSELNGYKIAKIQYAVFQAGSGTGSTVVGLRRYSSTRSVGYSNGYSADFAAGDLNEAITGSSTLVTGDLYVFHVNAHTMVTAATGLTAMLMLTK